MTKVIAIAGRRAQRWAATTMTGVVLFAAPLAHASPDDDLLRQLKADGITGPSDDVLLTSAHSACDLLATMNGDEVGTAVHEQTRLDDNQSTVFVADAMHYLCPERDHSGGQIWQTTHPGGHALQ